jgi:WD40 repeat protein
MKIFTAVLLILTILSDLRVSIALPEFQEVTPTPSTELIAVVWSPDGTMIAGGGTDGIVRVWDASTNAPLMEMVGDSEVVFAVAWSPDSTRLASGGRDGFTRIWNVKGADLPAGHLVAELEGLRDIVTIAWSPDGAMIASGSQMGNGSFSNLFIWDASSYGLINEIIIGAAVDIEWQPNNNNRIAVADQGQDVFVFDPTIDLSASARPRLPEALTVGPDEPATEISWNSDGTVFAFGSEWGKSISLMVQQET